jgi:hypothetical protein
MNTRAWAEWRRAWGSTWIDRARSLSRSSSPAKAGDFRPCERKPSRSFPRTRERAFTEFLDGRRLTADQLEFLDLVIDHLTARGVMDPKLLYEAPFTDFDRNGVEGVFEQSDVARLVQILRKIEPGFAA